MSGLARIALRPLPLLAAGALAAAVVLAPSSPSVPAGDQPAEAAVAKAGSAPRAGQARVAATFRAGTAKATTRARGRRRATKRRATARRAARAAARRPRARRAALRRPAARFALDGRRGTTVLRQRRYAGIDGPTLDVYRRTGIRHPVPAVLIVHGGGWAGGGKGRMVPVARAIARAGMVAVNVAYTLADWGRPGYPVQSDQLQAALRWVRRKAPRLGVDSERIGAFGSSAGGHLAALLATSARRAWDRPAIGAAVLWSAPLDLPALADHRMLGPAAELMLGCPATACPQRWQEASPIAAVSPGDAPLLLVNSRREMVPVDQPLRMAERLAAAGVPHELWLLDGNAHARDYQHRTLRRSVAFLKEWLH